MLVLWLSLSQLFSLFACPDPPEAPSAAYLSVSSSTSLRVDFQEPLSVNSAVVTKYKGQLQYRCMSYFYRWLMSLKQIHFFNIFFILF